MRLGVFGGSFDPVHYGHLLLAECCREQLCLEKVLFIPAGQPPHKRQRPLTPAEHRVAMLELAIGGEPGFEICRYEIERREVSYTVETLRFLKSQFPQAELFLLVGADMLNDLPNWREAAEVCRLAIPVGVRRAGMPLPCLDGLRAMMEPSRFERVLELQVDMPQIELSASEIRARVASGKSIRFRVPKAVEMYILHHGLYKDTLAHAATAEESQVC